MAKSRFEPKKIVRYSESSIPKNGISERPTPRIQASPAAAYSAVADAIASPAPPDTAPTPSLPIETFNYTSSFSFDGATELTGSYSNEGGRSFYMGTLHTTIAPGWAQEETGSFTLLTIKNKDAYPAPWAEYNRTFAIQRISGSNGYQDMLVCSISSGSVYSTFKGELNISPNFYSGSGGTNQEIFLQTYFIKGALYGHRIDGSANLNFKTTSADFNGSIQQLANVALDSAVHLVSIGGTHSTPNNFYKGTMANLSLAKMQLYYFQGSGMGTKAEKSAHIDMLYRFENDTSASKGGQDLEVIGTETYVSSSL